MKCSLCCVFRFDFGTRQFEEDTCGVEMRRRRLTSKHEIRLGVIGFDTGNQIEKKKTLYLDLKFC